MQNINDCRNDPTIKCSNFEPYLKRSSNNLPLPNKKSLSTQKSISRMMEKKPSIKINDENRDFSNIPSSTKHQNLNLKFQRIPVNNKSQIPSNITKPDESGHKETLMRELLRTYNDPKMRTKTLPDNFNIDCLKELEFSLERLPKKTENPMNICFKSIDDFSMIQQKLKAHEEKEKAPKKVSSTKNIIDIKDLEKFFNKKIDRTNDFHSPKNHPMRFLDRAKVNSNYEKDKERGKTAVHQNKRGDYENVFHKSQKLSKESISLNEVQTSFLYFAKINDCEKCLKILSLKEFTKHRPQLINYKGSNDWCPLHYASLNGNVKLVDSLLVNEAEIDAETSSKLTSLMIACQKGHEEITISLINAGADINLFDLSGNTPLHYGVLHGQKRIVELLLRKPSLKLNIKNQDKKTARELALHNPEILQLFEEVSNSQKGFGKFSNKVVIHKVNPAAISNFLGKHFYRFNAKQENPTPNNISNIQTTATYSSNSNTFNDFSFLGMNEDDNGGEHDQSKQEKEKITLDSFNIKGLIGKGSFGEVFLVEKKDTKMLYALKVLKKSIIMKNNLVKYALTERNVLSLTNHPFIVKLVFAFQSGTDLFLIMDYCPGGDLGQQLQREKKFSEERTKIYLAEIILALEDLHKRDIIFRDLKPDNIVLDKDGHALLTDFGLSKEGVLDHNQGARSFCGSLAYLAPEMLKRCGHGKAVDWYLLGVVMYEMLVGTPPYYTNNKEELFTNIENAALKIPAALSPSAKTLLKALLQRNPAKRLGSGKGDAEEIKNHPFFKGINWNDVERKKLKPPAPEIKYKFNPAVKGENLKAEYPENETNENNYISGWSFVSPNNNKY